MSWRVASELSVPARLLTATQICDLSMLVDENMLLNIIRDYEIYGIPRAYASGRSLLKLALSDSPSVKQARPGEGGRR